MKATINQIISTKDIASKNSQIDLPKIIQLGQTERLSPASSDQKKTLLLAIDIQNDFMEDIGTLPVSGSRQDLERLNRWIYENLDKLTQIICSLDTHSLNQIFHPSWWHDKFGNAPSPFTVITAKDVEEGKWTAINGNTDVSLEYLQNLEQLGQKQLCIWPYHCIEGTFGAQLESEFVKMLYFHAAARESKPIFVQKGQNPYSEMYGIIKAEYDPTNTINTEILDTIQQYDEIYIAGQASSHCVLASLEQILNYFEQNSGFTARITILEDCMSPIVGFENSTKQRFQELKEKYNIKIQSSTAVRL